MRIATFNLLHGQPDPARLGPAIARLEADVLGLQEVDRSQPRSDGADQTAVAAAALDAVDWRFVPTLIGTPGTERDWHAAAADAYSGPDGSHALPEGPSYGIGLVSRRPVREWRVLQLGSSNRSLPLLVPDEEQRPRVLRVPDEPRVALAAVLEGAHGPFTVVTTHLSFVPGTNVRQLREIRRWAGELPGPVVLVGDLNLPLTVARAVSWMTPLVRTATYPSNQPRVQLDHVLGDRLAPDALSGARGHRLAVSDHLALSVDLDL